MLELDTDNLTDRGQGFNLKKQFEVRSNFDQLFAGKYEKTLDPKVKDYVESKADELYLKETGQKKSDRSSQLWKSLRNVEVLKYDRSLWDTVQQVVVEQPRDARDNVLTSPVGSGPKMPGHTGHGMPERVETGTRAIGEGVGPKIPTSTAHENNEEAAVTNVFDIQRRNLNDHEDAGGHSVERHVGRSPNWLRNRIEREGLDTASSFHNESSANRTQGRFVSQYNEEIEAWLKTDERLFVREIEMKKPVGIVVEDGVGGSTETSRARIVIERDKTERGWHILTSFPVK
jgi:hypothetical protein